MVICLERVADSHMAQLMPLPLTVSCFSKIQTGFTFLYRLTQVVPEKGPLNRCVCNVMSTNPLFKVVGNKWRSRKELHTLSTKLSGFGFKDRGSFWPDSWQQNHWKHVMHTLHNYTVQPLHLANCHTPEHIHSSGISWTICKQSEPHSRQITTATPHHSIFYRSDALPAAQPTHTHTSV